MLRLRGRTCCGGFVAFTDRVDSLRPAMSEVPVRELSTSRFGRGADVAGRHLIVRCFLRAAVGSQGLPHDEHDGWERTGNNKVATTALASSHITTSPRTFPREYLTPANYGSYVNRPPGNLGFLHVVGGLGAQKRLPACALPHDATTPRRRSRSHAGVAQRPVPHKLSASSPQPRRRLHRPAALRSR